MLAKRPRLGHIRAMILRFVFVTALLLPALCSSAATLTLDYLKVGLVSYTNVTVLGANATDLYFTHAQGIANVKLKYLSPELQKRFNFDPQAAAEAEKKQSEADQLYQASEAKSFYDRSRAAAEAAEKVLPTSEDSLADPISNNSLLGKAAPVLEVEKWLTDRPTLEGKFVLVSFWAPWSIPCKKWLPELNALQKKFPSKLVVVGISADADIPSDLPIEFASAVDTKAKLSGALGINSVPSILLLDPKGIIRYQGHPAAVTEKKLKVLFDSWKE
jgi:cytochrome c biogenesis protein CcmG, thiol:disulfide interchange protein DsbE